MFHFIKKIVLLTWSWHVFQILRDQLMPRSTVEDSSLAAFVIGKVILSLLVEIFHICLVAPRADFNRRSPRDFRQTRSRSDFSVCVVAEFGGGVIHFASDLLVLICSRPRDLHQ